MANRRKLKKIVNMVTGDLLMECMAVKQANSHIDNADVENIAGSILLMQEDFLARISHVDKRQVRRFFRQLEEDFSTSTNEIIDNIFHLS